MEPTKTPPSSTSKPLAEESPKKAPTMDEVEREIDNIDNLLAGIATGLLREDPDPDSRLKLIAQLNQVSERKHRHSMEKQRLQLERDRFEHQREAQRQEREMRQQALEIRRQEVE